ncbi:hypothetical protein PGT21_023361 [Puccinia graminis f. sp. tritici]|uniref:Uncharacterized protein n=1 Tax=Puccinia graminis f. sp. tritici TaxID=56615 RepID=A0A5B0NCX7_PUCGR|nr:hypothetical protein PGT21_023361 [Puccinia graminis f. sp. tritici]
MRKTFWISVILTVSCLGILENWQCVQSVEDVKDLSSVAKRIRGREEFDEHLPSDHEETSKRKKILTGSGTSSRDLGLTSKSLITNAGKSELRTEAEKNVLKNFLNTKKAVNDWKFDFLQLGWTAPQQVRFQKEMQVVMESLSKLYEHKIYELRGEKFKFQVTPAGDSQMTDEKQQEEWLKSVADISKTWKDLMDPESGAHSILKRGSDLMIDCFIDMKRLGIITDGILSRFLNKNNEGDLITTYAICNFTPSLTLPKVYVNFNIKLSLLECPSTRKLSPLLIHLDPRTWERIEFDFLGYWLGEFQAMYPSLSEETSAFDGIIDTFLKVASPDNQSGTEVEALLKDLLLHISSQTRIRLEEGRARRLIEFKLLYDMTKFIMSCHSSRISVEFLGKLKRSLLFNQIRTFEESVGLFSSIMHSVHVRRKATLLAVPMGHPELLEKLKNGVEKLIDSNRNRQISSFANLADDVNQVSYGKYQKIAETNAEEFVSQFESSLTKMLPADPMEIRYSIGKIKEQFQRYWIQFQILMERESMLFQNFSELMAGFSRGDFYLVHQLEKGEQELFKRYGVPH